VLSLISTKLPLHTSIPCVEIKWAAGVKTGQGLGGHEGFEAVGGKAKTHRWRENAGNMRAIVHEIVIGMLDGVWTGLEA
jgi:hypothetical protein